LNSFKQHNYLTRRSILLFAAILFILSLITSYYFQVKPSVSHQQKLLQKFIVKEQTDAEQVVADTALMRKLSLQQESLEEFDRVANKSYGLFLFAETISDNQDMLFWNNQKIVPPVADFSLPDGAYFQHLPNGYYVLLKKRLHFSGMTNNVMSYVLIPILNQYYLETDYLVTQFAHDKEAVNKIAISDKPTAFPLYAADGKQLFYIRAVAHSSIYTMDTASILLRLVALLLLFFFVHLTAESIVKTRGAIRGIFFLALVILFSRTIIYVFPTLFSLRQLTLFDPTVYASNWVNKSLGDLLINSILLCWFILFISNTIAARKNLPAIPRQYRYGAGVLAIFFLDVSTFEFADIVHSLVADSKISFHVTDFFSLSIYTVFGFIVLAILSLSYYYFTRLLFRFILPIFKQPLFIYFSIAIIGLFFLTLRSGESLVLFHIPILVWLILYTVLVNQERFAINRFSVTVAGILFWIFIFSASLAVLILEGNKENESRTRRAIAQKYDQLTDPSSERTLSIAITYIDNRFLANNFKRFLDEKQSRYIRDSISSENFKGYINRYETSMYLFDSANRPINNTDPRSFAELNTIFTVQSKPTGITDLYYHETSFDRFAYITKRVIRDSTGFVGTFFLISTPKEYGTTDALYPVLFRQVNKNDVENSPVYSYAIYKNNLLITSSAKYPFQITLTKDQLPEDEYENRTNGDFDELWYRANNRKVIVIAKQRDSTIESITLFSYLFCSFLFMVGILQLFSFLLKVARDVHALNVFSGLSIRTQIHGTVIFVSILSFLIIGAATIEFFIVRYKRNNIDKLSTTAGIAVKEIEKRAAANNIFNNQFDYEDSTTNEVLKNLVKDIADIHNVDVNLYDLQGNLQMSSDEEVYQRGILSNKMHPLAFYHLSNLREVQRVQDEDMSSLQYLSIYTVIRDYKGSVYAYLNIPYFSSQMDLRQEISNFLVTIINLNAFIFLIAGVIALFITNKITESFSVIGSKMKDITLGKTNEPIVWNKNDEIGDLVKQYNKMVHQLEESALALAKSEREGAWREMARQVAHEIKNPLTPMKLSIQYLQKAVNNNQGNVKELTGSVSNTLIEQIDHLSKIAADFSQFANIGIKKVQLLDLHQVILSLVELYQSNPKVHIDWEKVEGSVVMKTDKTHMNRLFTNLMANAVDACARKQECNINISEERKDGSIIISVQDNGEGIPEEKRSKIFTPNFTTKTSGTGLGLAMCKSIVEQAGGKIWFETNENVGTTFYVRFPTLS
jgi:two-component system, NtrC family, nitrogen regulation sensor histidine kinase NtrY